VPPFGSSGERFWERNIFLFSYRSYRWGRVDLWRGPSRFAVVIRSFPAPSSLPIRALIMARLAARSGSDSLPGSVAIPAW
jgi:hypothetical protein